MNHALSHVAVLEEKLGISAAQIRELAAKGII